MDKNGKLFGKISIIDLLVLLAVVALAIGLVYRFVSPAAQVAAGDATILYTVRIEGVRDFTLPHYQIGLNVYDRMTSQFIGNISGVRYEQHLATAVDLYGEIIRVPAPGQIMIFVDIVADGRITEQSYFAQGTFEVNVGSAILMNTKYVQVAGVIDGIQILPVE